MFMFSLSWGLAPFLGTFENILNERHVDLGLLAAWNAGGLLSPSFLMVTCPSLLAKLRSEQEGEANQLFAIP